MLALYDIHGNVDALEAVEGVRFLNAGSVGLPCEGGGERSVGAALVAPVEAIVVTRIFEDLAA